MTTATTEVKIWQALKARAETQPTSFPLDMPNSDFAKPSDATKGALPYIEVRNLPNTLSRVGITTSTPMDRPGILQMSLMYPVGLKKSHDVMLQYAGLIAAHFPNDLKMAFDGVTVRVERAPDVAQGFRDDAYWRYPVTIRWRTFA